MRTLITLLLLAGCGPEYSWGWREPPADWRSIAAAHPKAPAVILDRNVRLFISVEPRQRAEYQLQRYERRLIVTEGGYRYAQVRLPAEANGGKMVELRARTIGPDGRIHEVDARRVLTDENRGGKEQEGARVQVKLLSFPDVQVGSILELSWTFAYPDYPLDWIERVADALPIEHYHFEAVTTPSVRSAVRGYNLSQRLTQSELGERQRVSLDLDRVPAFSDEERTPAYELYQPWLALRLHAIVWGLRVFLQNSDWPHALRGLAKQLYLEPDKTIGGAEVTLGPGCDGARCWIERALAFANEHTRLISFRLPRDRVRPAREVLASGRASNVEKAILLQYALAHHGVVARLAGVSRAQRDRVEGSFANPRAFDHMIVYVPKQNGLDEPMWLDPSCEWCAAGQVPSWIRGARGVPFFGKSVLGVIEAEASVEPIAGPDGGPDRISRTREVLVDAGGDVTESDALTQFGSYATDRQIETIDWSEKGWRSSAESIAASQQRGARVLADEHPPCLARTGQCRRVLKMLLPGYAVADGGGLVLPLSLLRSGNWDGVFEHAERSGEFQLARGGELRFDETLQVRPPPGYTVDGAPAPFHRESEAVDVTLEVQTTADGLTLRRTLSAKPGIFLPGGYAEARAALRAFTEVRSQVVTLKRKN
jgi:Domain of Unknown Function with PDB structure (DUF3857)